MSTPVPMVRIVRTAMLGIGPEQDPGRVSAPAVRTLPHRSFLTATLLMFGALTLASGTAWPDELVLRPSGSTLGPQTGGNVVLVGLANETALQGLQFRLEYDPAAARPVSVTALERLGDPARLQYRIERGTIRAFICDLGSACASIAPGTGPIVSVAFAPVDGAGRDTLRVALRDALEVTESLVARDVAGSHLALPVSRGGLPAEKPAAGTQGLGSGDASADIPARFDLRATGPNPFSSRTTLGLDVPRPAHVRVAIYDTRGRLVRVLRDQSMNAGRHTVHWDGLTDNGSRAGAGLFFVRVTAEGSVFNRKIIALQ